MLDSLIQNVNADNLPGSDIQADPAPGEMAAALPRGKPEALRVVPENIPQPLRARPRWVVWRFVWDPDKRNERGGKGDWDKPPFCAHTGGPASSTDATTWAAFDQVLAAYQTGNWDGVGYVPTPEDGLTAFDLDHCRNPQTASIEPWAQDVVGTLDSYTEVSPSASGLRIVAYGQRPDCVRTRRKVGNGVLEVYDGRTKDGKAGGRYLTFTGQRLEARPTEIQARQEAITAVYLRLLNPPKPTPGTNGESTVPRPYEPKLTDQEIIDLASRAKNGAKFKRLWAGDTSGYASASEADLAFCGLVEFYTGPDPERIDRLLRQSGLMRDKWLREDYPEDTIRTALAGRTDFYAAGGGCHRRQGVARAGDGEADEDPSGDTTKAKRKVSANGITYSAEGMVSVCGQFRLTLNKEKTRWRVLVSRNDVTLGADVINPADSKARRALLRSLGTLTEEETGELDRALVRLSGQVEAEWKEFCSWQASEQQASFQRKEEEAAKAAAKGREKQLREIALIAWPVLDDPALLWRIGEAVARRGVINERANSILLVLAVVSQITKAPISIIVKGDSAGGKSFLVLQVLVLVPGDWHIDLTSMSERALIYDERDYAHKTVVIFEVHGEASELASYLIRTLISEGCIRHQTVEPTPEGLVGREIVKQGPTNFITTTTFPEVHPENETRIWTLLVDDSPATTKLVLAMQAKTARGSFRPAEDGDLRQAFEWLKEAGLKEAVVPFAELLAEAMPDKPLRLRRDFPRLLQLIAMSAIVHQRQRERDAEGRVVASLADYAMVRELVAPVFERGVLGLTAKTQELVDALQTILNEKEEMSIGEEHLHATYADLVKKTGKPKCYLTRWLKPALELGVVDNTNAGQRGKAAALRMGGYQLGQCAALPTVEELATKLQVAVEWVDPLTGKVLRAGCNTTASEPDSSQVVMWQGDVPRETADDRSVAVLR